MSTFEKDNFLMDGATHLLVIHTNPEVAVKRLANKRIFDFSCFSSLRYIFEPFGLDGPHSFLNESTIGIFRILK